MICDKHEECTEGDCQCPEYRERQNIEAEVDAVNRADAIRAEAVLWNLQHAGSSLAKMIVDGAGREQARAFVHLVLRTAKAINC
jgi:hypothetical protein